MANWGVTPDGFTRPRLAEIRSEIKADIEATFRLSIPDTPDSVWGKFIGIFADREDVLWSVAEQTYFAMYPHTAEDNSLVNAVAFSGVRPIQQEKTRILGTCIGANNTTFDIGRIRSKADKTYTFTTTGTGKISTGNAVYAEISVLTVTVGSTYSLTISGQTYSYEAQVGDTAAAILVALSALISALEADVTVANGILTIDKIDHRTGYVLSVSTNMQIAKVGSPVEFSCDIYGSVNPGIGTVTEIITQFSGWEQVINRVAAIVGRDAETEIALRQRYGRSVYTKGKSLIEAMQARIYEEVEGVSADIVFENDTDEIDADGRPPHCLEVVVDGGDDAAVAKKIWETKPPGIGTYGSIVVNVVDSQGTTQTVRFNRPTRKKVWLKAVLFKNEDEDFPEDTPQTVQGIILATGINYKTGQNVILQRFLGPIYKDTIGISVISITATVSDTMPAPEDYSSDNILIGVRDIAEFDISRIQVNVEEVV